MEIIGNTVVGGSTPVYHEEPDYSSVSTEGALRKLLETLVAVEVAPLANLQLKRKCKKLFENLTEGIEADFSDPRDLFFENVREAPTPERVVKLIAFTQCQPIWIESDNGGRLAEMHYDRNLFKHREVALVKELSQ